MNKQTIERAGGASCSGLSGCVALAIKYRKYVLDRGGKQMQYLSEGGFGLLRYRAGQELQ